MRSLFVVMIVSGVALANVPNGRYRLHVKGGWQEILGPTQSRAPSCGRRAAELIANIGTLKVEVASNITVNGVVWKPGPASPKGLSVVNDRLLEGFVIQLTFYRERASAKGMVAVVGLSGDVIQCGDALRLEGTYTK